MSTTLNVKNQNVTYGTYGLRRADGTPWRSEPSTPGATNYYSVGDELTDDGMVLVCGGSFDAVAGANGNDMDDAPHRGRVVVVMWRYSAGSYAWEDCDPQELLSRARASVVAHERYVEETNG